MKNGRKGKEGWGKDREEGKECWEGRWRKEEVRRGSKEGRKGKRERRKDDGVKESSGMNGAKKAKKNDQNEFSFLVASK